MVIDQLKLYLSNAIFLSLFIYWRSATELFETYCMKGMTFNPPVASVTPRRKVLSHLSVSFFNHVTHQCNLYLLAHYAVPRHWHTEFGFWFVYFLHEVYFLNWHKIGLSVRKEKIAV